MTRTLPPGRYASATPKRPRKTLVWALGAGVIVLGLVIAYLAYDKFAVNEIDTELTSFEVVDDGTLEVTFTVTREDPADDAVCIVRARSRDGSETGRREVYIPEGDSATVLLTSPVHTSQRPAVGDVYGCSLDGPAYLTGDSIGN